MLMIISIISFSTWNIIYIAIFPPVAPEISSGSMASLSLGTKTMTSYKVNLIIKLY